jgi:mannose-6-phosphate isomerase-like protein (cupin superfamily)
MDLRPRSHVLHHAAARTHLPGPDGAHSVSLFRRGMLDVKLAGARPVPTTALTPHDQDEIYLIVRGRGVLFHDGRRDSFEAGDLLFVAAGTEHRFEDYTADLSVWVVFFGPPGGEAA